MNEDHDTTNAADVKDSMRAAWDDVSDGFTRLGQLIRDRYRESAADDDTPATGTVNIASATTAKDSSHEAGTTDAADAFRKVFDKLIDAARELGDRASDITHSEEIRSQARNAAQSLNSALSQTVDSFVDDLSELFDKLKDGVKNRTSTAKESSDADDHELNDADPPVSPI